PKVIERALKGGYEPVALLMNRRDIDGEAADIISMCNGTPVFTADSETIVSLTGFKLIRGALCAMKRRMLPSVKDVCRNARRIAVLENVVNPTNVGAIFRSAAALNMDAVLLTSGCSDPLYRRSSRVSMGTVFQVPWTYMKTSAADISLLHNLGFKTAAMALEKDSVNIDDRKLLCEDKLAVILGTEGEGLSHKTISDSDYTVCIPMSHEVDSLNVAAASAVAFWQLGNR
ncbi:MAG: TrmH family RNA methyltransferase, partial [Ruminococcus sp.]